MSHFSMGAINKLTNEYEYPRIAEKGLHFLTPFIILNADLTIKI
jgi:hypothetical protein